MRGRTFKTTRDKATGETLVLNRHKGQEHVVHRSDHPVDNRTVEDLAFQTGGLQGYRELSKRKRKERAIREETAGSDIEAEVADIKRHHGRESYGWSRPGPKTAELPSPGVSNGRECRWVTENGKLVRKPIS